MRRLTLCALLAAGCSGVFMEKIDVPPPPGREPRCTTTQGWVFWDAIIATSNVIFAAWSYSTYADTANSAGVRNSAGLRASISAGVAVPYLISMGVGIGARGRCVDARERHDEWLRARHR